MQACVRRRRIRNAHHVGLLANRTTSQTAHRRLINFSHSQCAGRFSPSFVAVAIVRNDDGRVSRLHRRRADEDRLRLARDFDVDALHRTCVRDDGTRFPFVRPFHYGDGRAVRDDGTSYTPHCSLQSNLGSSSLAVVQSQSTPATNSSQRNASSWFGGSARGFGASQEKQA